MTQVQDSPPGARDPGPGRPQVTSHSELEHVALELFIERGFDETSVDEIAAAAGISRRTFFRYYRSKNDVPWGDFDAQLARFERWFDECPPELPVAAAIRAGVVEFNSFDPVSLRDRMQVILGSPALQAYSTIRYAAWRAVITRFAARRLGLRQNALVPLALGHAALGAALAAFEFWLADESTDLLEVLDRSLRVLGEPG